MAADDAIYNMVAEQWNYWFVIDVRRLVNPFTSLWVTTAFGRLGLLRNVVGHSKLPPADPSGDTLPLQKAASRVRGDG
jgi:hypothetical protein